MARLLCSTKLLLGFAGFCKQQDSIQEAGLGPGLLMPLTVLMADLHPFTVGKGSALSPLGQFSADCESSHGCFRVG